MVFIRENDYTTCVGDRSFALASGYVEIEDSVYEDLIETKKMWKDGEIVDDPTYEERKKQELIEQANEQAQIAISDEISELKQNLLDTDYKVLKYIEGQLSDLEYEEIKTQRQEWRDRINELEENI